VRTIFAALIVAFTLGAPAQAEIFKCVGPNGDVRFTSDAAQCPNAAPHAPKEIAVQRVAKAQPRLASARPGAPAKLRSGPPPPSAPSAAMEATWRGKKQEAENTVRTLEAAQKRILAAVRWCNKGYGVAKENARTGLREQVPCDDVDAEKMKIDAELERSRTYLATGLEEECRRAGCLPGWVR
jgi:hypothetical protein